MWAPTWLAVRALAATLELAVFLTAQEGGNQTDQQGGNETCAAVCQVQRGDYLAALDTLPWERILGIVIVLLAGWYVSKLVVRLLGRSVARQFGRPSVTRTILRSIRLGILGIAVIVASAIAGLRIGDLLISVTVLSAVVGITLAPIASSIINGLFVLADQPYEIGDMIELADRNQRGFVDDITLRYTKIFTLDNTFMVIPNSTIRNRDVVNYSAEDERTRLSLQILVTYESDIDAARNLIERAARGVDVVIEGGPNIRIGSARYPAGPTCYIDEFADSGVLLNLRYWVKQPYKLLTARSLVQTAVREELAKSDAEIEFAYPHSHLVFDETSGEARVAVADRPTNGSGPLGGSGTERGESRGSSNDAAGETGERPGTTVDPDSGPE